MKKLLFARDSASPQPLRALIEKKQNPRTLAARAIDCAPRLLAVFEARCPGEARPREALRAAPRLGAGRDKDARGKRPRTLRITPRLKPLMTPPPVPPRGPWDTSSGRSTSRRTLWAWPCTG